MLKIFWGQSVLEQIKFYSPNFPKKHVLAIKRHKYAVLLALSGPVAGVGLGCDFRPLFWVKTAYLSAFCALDESFLLCQLECLHAAGYGDSAGAGDFVLQNFSIRAQKGGLAARSEE